MATTKYTRVSEEDDPLASAGPVHPSIAELVRQEVQTAIKGLHETWVAPPSYSSSAPLLSSTPTDDHVDTEANQPVTPPPPLEPPLTTSPWGWCKFAITMGAMILWMCGWGVLIGTGVDPLAFSMLAFFLMLALIYYIVIFAWIHIRITGQPKKPDPVPLTPEDRRRKLNGIMAFSIGMLGMFIMFYGIIWGWAVMVDEPRGVWPTYKVSMDLQAKIDAQHALSRLAACLHEAIPERNATIADISTCLKAMGMKEAYEQVVPTVLV